MISEWNQKQNYLIKDSGKRDQTHFRQSTYRSRRFFFIIINNSLFVEKKKRCGRAKDEERWDCWDRALDEQDVLFCKEEDMKQLNLETRPRFSSLLFVRSQIPNPGTLKAKKGKTEMKSSCVLEEVLSVYSVLSLCFFCRFLYKKVMSYVDFFNYDCLKQTSSLALSSWALFVFCYMMQFFCVQLNVFIYIIVFLWMNSFFFLLHLK